MSRNAQFEGKTFLGIADTVYICGAVYPKTAEALWAAKAAMTEAGYVFNEDGTHARLEVSAAKCGSCGRIIDRRGVARHGHVCEHCGAPTAVEYVKGGHIRVAFLRRHEAVADGKTLSFRIFGYDAERGEMAVYADPVFDGPHGARPGLLDPKTPEAARRVLEEAEGLYRLEERDDDGEKVSVAVFRYPGDGMIDDDSVVDTHGVSGGTRNWRDVQVYNGVEYSAFADLPIPDSVSLRLEFIGGAKLSLSDPKAHEIILHAGGAVSDAGWYHQDGRPGFFDVMWKRWDAFVEHFVGVDHAEWRKFVARAPADGPGFIRALSKWCTAMAGGAPHPVTDEPNVGNTLEAFCKVMDGGRLSYQEAVAAEDGASEFEQVMGFSSGLGR
jgi:hypothetical protein